MACPFVFPALLLSFCLPVCRCYRSLPVNSFHISGELGGHSPPASTFRVCDEKHGCRIMVCFLRRKTLRMALNLLSASWFSLFWNNYVTPTRAAEQTGLNKMMNACKRGGGGLTCHDEDGIGPASERPSSCLTNLCSGKWILCYSHFDINCGLKYIIQLAEKLQLWGLSCEAPWHMFLPLL